MTSRQQRRVAEQKIFLQCEPPHKRSCAPLLSVRIGEGPRIGSAVRSLPVSDWTRIGKMPEIDFVATDELPAPHHVTVVSVFGSNFTPLSEVNISIHHGRAVIAHGFRPVGNDGTFQWGSVVSPRLACDPSLWRRFTSHQRT